MTEDEARAWFSDRYPAGAMDRLNRFAEMLLAESRAQSLIAASTASQLWSRHMLDSAQLLALAPTGHNWLDIGSGGGLPGIVVGILSPTPIMLVEPRKLRATFLARVIDDLDLAHVSVVTAKVQSVSGVFGIITARAVAPIEQLFAWTTPHVSRETTYVLPRGGGALEELESARRTWHGTFHVEQSLTNPESGIVIASGVRRR